MLPYLLLVSFVMFWIFLEKKTLNRKAFWVPLFILIVFASIRSYLVGTDTGSYTADFRNLVDPDYYIFNSDIEYGYQLLEYFLLEITHNYFWLFFITSFLIVYSYLKTIKNISIDYALSVFIFITLGFYTFSFNGLRQGIAIALCFLSLPYFLEQKLYKYFGMVILASFFHISAIIMLAFYLLINFLKIKLEFKLILCFIFSVILSQKIINYMALHNERYTHYTEKSEGGGYIILAFFTLMGFIFYITNRNLRNDNIVYAKLEELYLCGIAFVVPLALLGASASGPQRFLIYFTVLIIFLLPYTIRDLKYYLVKVFFILFGIVYFYLTTNRFSNLSPYSINPIFEFF